MRLQLRHAYELFGVLRQIDTECRMHISALGWEISLSRGYEAIKMTVPPAAFKYYIPIKATKQIGLDIKKIYDLLDFYERWYRGDIPEPEVTFKFEWDEHKTYTGTKEPECTLKLVIGNVIVETIKLPYYDSIRTPEKTPNLNYSATIGLKTDELLQATRRANEFTEEATLIARNNDLTKPEDIGYSSLTLEAEDEKQTQKLTYPFRCGMPVIGEKEVKSTYKLRNIKNIVNKINSQETTLQFSTEYPLHVSFKLCDEKASCSYYLSPKTEGGEIR